MENDIKSALKVEEDGQASSRKKDHIDMAFKSDASQILNDKRFYYEPLMSGHPNLDSDWSFKIGGKTMQFPIWVSSMTGGTEKGQLINSNLAKICGEFGLGMGLGSCRQLLYEDKRLHEFDVRQYIKDQPLFVNLGIAQLEELILDAETERITELIGKLNSDGLIIHVNPLQEWLQPEGDRFKAPALETIQNILSKASYPIIVKEVGQGFGKASLKALLELPLEAIDLAGYGGTNFSTLELMRSDETRYNSYEVFTRVGHTCNEMIHWINEIVGQTTTKVQKIIISGGVKSFLDGYYMMEKCRINSIYAQASGFLKHALDYKELRNHTQYQIEGLKMARAFLKINDSDEG